MTDQNENKEKSGGCGCGGRKEDSGRSGCCGGHHEDGRGGCCGGGAHRAEPDAARDPAE